MGTAATVDKASFIRLVYSFHHEAVPAHEVVDRIAHDQTRFDWADRTIIKTYVLPHLAEHINVAPHEDTREVAHWWELNIDAAGHRRVPDRWILHATKSRTMGVLVDRVELVVFATHIGFLIIDVRPMSDELDDWLDLLHLGRFYRLPSQVESASGSEPLDIAHENSRDDANTFSRRAVLVQPDVDDPGESFTTSGERLGFGSLIATLVGDALGEASWTRASTPGRMFAYSGFSIDAEEPQLVQEASYRWGKMLRSTSVVRPLAGDEAAIVTVPYAEGIHFSLSMDGGGLFAAGAPDSHFFESDLFHHAHRPYFFGFLLAAHQRLSLTRHSEQVANIWQGGRPNAEGLERLQDDFLFYLSSCSFVQVMQTANHHAHHRKWLEVLEVERFQSEVESELRRLYERVSIRDQIEMARSRDREERRAKLVDGRLAGLGLAFALPSLGLAAMSVVVPDGASTAAVIAVTLVLTLPGIVYAFLQGRAAE
jgi:hypothetical protein